MAVGQEITRPKGIDRGGGGIPIAGQVHLLLGRPDVSLGNDRLHGVEVDLDRFDHLLVDEDGVAVMVEGLAEKLVDWTAVGQQVFADGVGDSALGRPTG